MKTIIIEGTDRTGKSTLIESICRYYAYDNIIVRHLGKPPKNISNDDLYKWQMKCFIKEGKLAHQLKEMEADEFCYYENKIIYNRYCYGEYVYGIMFRDYREEFISHRLNEFEKRYINLNETHLITMIGDPVFLLSQEDGKSFSQNLDQKTQEIDLFKTIHEKSIIANKLLLNVDNGIGEYLPKEQLLKTVLEFIQ